MSKTFLTEVTCIWGGRGSGKTTKARDLIAAAKPARTVIIDPLSADGTDAAGVAAALDAGKAVVICNSNAKADQINAILVAYLKSTKAAPVFCVCDEAPAYLDKTTAALNKIMFQGRHRAFGMVIIGQRPAAVCAQIRSQAAITYWMKLTDHVDLQTAAQSLGPDARDKLPMFQPGECIQHPPEPTRKAPK